MGKIKAKRIIKGVLIGLCVTCLTLFVLVVSLIYLVLTGGPAKVTKNIKNYSKIFDEPGLHTGYITFPEEIPESAEVVKFYHSFRNTIDDATIETFLQCTYSDDDFSRELYRLENTSKTYGNRKEVLHRDEDGKYPYPAYIAVENADYTYEYAMITGENQITYICTMFTDADSIHFDKKYLPSDFMTDEGRGFDSGYSIYYKTVSKGLIATDYTRDPNPEVSNGHSVILGDDLMVVNYTLDSQGREIITGVEYCVDEMNFDEKDDEELNQIDDKDTRDHSFDGDVFVSLKADYDNNRVIFTYEEDGQEKTKIYPED